MNLEDYEIKSTYLIDKINLMCDEEFIKWYQNNILYNTGYFDEEKILRRVLSDSTYNKYFRLFQHFKKYDEKKNDPYNDLIGIVIDEKKFWISMAKKTLTDKILSIIPNVYKMTIDLNTYIIDVKTDTYTIVVKEISKITTKSKYYENRYDTYEGEREGEREYDEGVDCDLIQFKYIVLRVIEVCDQLTFNAKYLNLCWNKYEGYHNLEFDNYGMKKKFVDVEIQINKYC